MWALYVWLSQPAWTVRLAKQNTLKVLAGMAPTRRRWRALLSWRWCLARKGSSWNHGSWIRSSHKLFAFNGMLNQQLSSFPGRGKWKELSNRHGLALVLPSLEVITTLARQGRVEYNQWPLEKCTNPLIWKWILIRSPNQWIGLFPFLRGVFGRYPH